VTVAWPEPSRAVHEEYEPGVVPSAYCRQRYCVGEAAPGAPGAPVIWTVACEEDGYPVTRSSARGGTCTAVGGSSGTSTASRSCTRPERVTVKTTRPAPAPAAGRVIVKSRYPPADSLASGVVRIFAAGIVCGLA